MTSRLFALHGLRLLAATLVAIAHLIMRLLDYGVVGQDWHRFTIAGRTGVYTFFAISGLIMIRTSLSNFGKPGAPGQFILRRLIRILPIYYIFTLLYIVRMQLVHEPWTPMELLLSFLFIPYVNPNELMQPIYSLGWTLNYEMYFYLVLGLCLFFSRWVGIAALFASLTLVIIFGQLFGNSLPNGDPQDLLAFLGNPVVLFFLAGIVIGLLPAPFRLEARLGLSVAAALLVAAVLIADPTVVVICSVAAVWIVSCEHPPLSVSVPERAMELLGESSYSIYLTHSFVLGPAFAVGLAAGLLSNGVSAWVYSVAMIGACVAAGTIAYVLLERPLLAVLRRKLLARPRPAAGPDLAQV